MRSRAGATAFTQLKQLKKYELTERRHRRKLINKSLHYLMQVTGVWGDPKKTRLFRLLNLVEEVAIVDAFGKRLARALRMKEMTQSELAERAGVTTAAVSHYVHGVRLPQMAVLMRIASALDLSVQELVGLEGICVDESDLDAAFRMVLDHVDELSDAEKAELILALANIKLS